MKEWTRHYQLLLTEDRDKYLQQETSVEIENEEITIYAEIVRNAMK